MPRDNRPFLTMQEVADMLGVPPTWFYNGNAVRDGLRVYKFGKYLRVHPSDLEDYLAQCDKTNTAKEND